MTAVNLSMLGASNKMWPHVSDEGMRQFATLTAKRPELKEQLLALLADPKRCEELGKLGPVATKLAPVSRYAFEAIKPFGGVFDAGARTAKFGSDLIAKLPGPFRAVRERVAERVADVQDGVHLIHKNDELVSGYLKFAHGIRTGCRH